MMPVCTDVQRCYWINKMSSKYVACLGKGGQRDMAESFARRAGVTLLDKPGEELTVLFDAKGVSLIGYGLSYQGSFRADH